MTQGVGLSVGATNLVGVVPGCAAATRQSVLTLYRHRPPEIGVPSENARLDGRGLVVTGFVDRSGDPVGIMAADGSFHRGETLIADALRALTVTVTGGRAPLLTPGVTFPAHWRAGAVEALRRELASSPEWSARPEQLTLISDAAAALTALQAEPGLPTRGVVALCDFGGTGTTISLVDAANGYRPICAAVRHADFSGELIDRALMAHVITDLAVSGTSDLAGTAAIGSLHRLRAQCRGAKERLSRASATTLLADVPGGRGDIRLTRSELDDEIREPLAAFIEVLHEHLFRNRIRPADLAAIASVGGGASIPTVTTTLSAQLRVPVITTPQPELSAARGAAMRAVRRPEDDSLTAVASPVQSGTLRALAWSEVDSEVDLKVDSDPDIAAIAAARPRVHFVPEEPSRTEPSGQPWNRALLVTAGMFAAMVLVGTGAVLALRNDAAAMTGTTTTTTTIQPDPIAPAAAPPAEPPITPEQVPSAPSLIRAQAPVTRVLVAAPPAAAMAAPAPAALPPAPENPPPPIAPPPTTTTPTTTTPPPPSSPPSSPPPPSSEPPSSEPSTPPSPPKPPPAEETPPEGEPPAPESPPSQKVDLPK